MSERTLPRPLWVLAAVASGLVACGAPPPAPAPRRPVHALVDELPAAELAAEVDEIDLGTHEGAAHLVSGWSWNERSRDGTTFVWGTGEESVVELFVARPRALALRLRCRSHRFDRAAPQRVEMAVGERVVADVEIPPAWTELAMTLPPEALTAGRNRLRLRYRQVRGPGEGGGDRRPIAVAWDWIRLAAEGGGEPVAVEDGEALRLPAGSQADFFLRLPAGAELAVDRLELPKDGATELFVGLRREGEEERVLTRRTDADAGMRLALGAAPGLARLRLRVARAGAGDPGAAVLRSPVVDAPRPARAERSEGGPRSPAAVGGAGEPRPELVILYVVDTLRADRLGAYGSERGLTPRLDALAADSVVFRGAVAQSSWTLPSMASVFTGLEPWVHGAVSKESRLPAELPTLPRLLDAAGWATWAVVANGYVSQPFGFAAGFDRFDFVASLETRADEVHRRALAWLDQGLPAEPLFLYLHTIDPHTSYDPPEDLRRRIAPGVRDPSVGSRSTVDGLKEGSVDSTPERIADERALYDAEVASADRELGRFLDDLERRGLWQRALFVFLSDHGEELHDHGSWLHGHSLHAELVDVPLMVRFPEDAHGGTVIGRAVQQVDLLPTLAGLLGLDAPHDLAGETLLRDLQGDSSAGEPRTIVSFLAPRAYSVIEDGWKLILSPGGGWRAGAELYDRSRDPAERSNLADERPVLAGFLASRLRARLAGEPLGPASESAELDDRTRRQLEALGYLE